MRSSASLALAAAALLAASLALKIGLTWPRGPAVPAVQARSLALGRFLAAQALAARSRAPQPVGLGWRLPGPGCELLAFPSGPRGAMEMTALSRAGPGDRVAYVYRGRLTARPPTVAVALDQLAWLAARPFRAAGPEPGYVLIIARGCRTLPDLPWAKLGA